MLLALRVKERLSRGPNVSALGQFQLAAQIHQRLVLLLPVTVYRRPIHSLPTAALSFVRQAASVQQSVLSDSRHCPDDVSEVLGSGFLALFRQITAQINTLVLADPEQAMPSEPPPCLSSLVGELPQTNSCCEAHSKNNSRGDSVPQTHITGS